MLNLVLRDKIEYPEYRLLYDSKMRLSSHKIRQEIRDCVKALRAKYVKNDADKLNEKLITYPNAGDWYRAKVIELERMIFDVNKPIPVGLEGLLRSIEFEVVFNSRKSMAEFVTVMRTKKLVKAKEVDVTVKADNSLRPDDEDRHGITQEVVLTYKSGNEQAVYDVCAALHKRAYINNSCGTHVHFDMRGVDEKTVKQYGSRLARCVPALRYLLPKARRENQYCKTIINDMRPRTERTARYSFINLQAYTKYQTIEVRGHSATMRAEKILNWIKICEKIMTTRIRTKDEEVKDPIELIKIFKFEKEMAQYIHERYNKFNPGVEIPALPEMEARPIPPAPAE